MVSKKNPARSGIYTARLILLAVKDRGPELFTDGLKDYERLMPTAPEMMERRLGLGYEAAVYLAERVAFYAMLLSPPSERWKEAGWKGFTAKIRACAEDPVILEQVREAAHTDYRERYAVRIAAYWAIQRNEAPSATQTDAEWIEQRLNDEWLRLTNAAPVIGWPDNQDKLIKFLLDVTTLRPGLDEEKITEAVCDQPSQSRVARVLADVMLERIEAEAFDRRRKGNATTASAEVLRRMRQLPGGQVHNSGDQLSLIDEKQNPVVQLAPGSINQMIELVERSLPLAAHRMFPEVVYWIHAAAKELWYAQRGSSGDLKEIKLPTIEGEFRGLYEQIYGDQPTRPEQVRNLRTIFQLLRAIELPHLSQHGIHATLVSWKSQEGRGRGKKGWLDLTFEFPTLPSFREFEPLRGTAFRQGVSIPPLPNTFAHGKKHDMHAGERYLWLQLAELMRERAVQAKVDGGVLIEENDLARLAQQIPTGGTKRNRWTAEAVERTIEHWITTGNLKRNNAGRILFTAEAEWEHLVRAGEQIQTNRAKGRASLDNGGKVLKDKKKRAKSGSYKKATD